MVLWVTHAVIYPNYFTRPNLNQLLFNIFNQAILIFVDFGIISFHNIPFETLI